MPVGVFLSSGIDSSALVGLIQDAGGQDVETLTLTFAEFAGRRDDEAPLAAEVARTYGVRHTVRRVDPRRVRARSAENSSRRWINPRSTA